MSGRQCNYHESFNAKFDILLKKNNYPDECHRYLIQNVNSAQASLINWIYKYLHIKDNNIFRHKFWTDDHIRNNVKGHQIYPIHWMLRYFGILDIIEHCTFFQSMEQMLVKSNNFIICLTLYTVYKILTREYNKTHY